MMKLPLIAALLLVSAVVFAQEETEMPAKVKEMKAYIETVDLEHDLITAFLTDMSQFSIINLELRPSTVIVRDKKNLDRTALKTGMQFKFTSSYYPISGKRVIDEMDVSSLARTERQFKGRLDYVHEDFVYSDGNRVSLQKGTKIEGRNGYDGKYDQFKTNMVGALTTIDGAFSNGVYKAEKAIIKPDMTRYQDIVADTANSKAFKIFFPDWMDKPKRKNLLGKKLGNYTVNRNEALQDFMQDFGTKLVPAQYRNRNFMFIVVQDDAAIARACANGITFISTGMLLLIENEAQLAAILSHEIVHAIYEHAADSQRSAQMAEANKQASKAANLQAQKTAQKNESRLTKDLKKSGDAIGKYVPAANDFEKMTGSIFDNRLALYSIFDERQADRVGLTIMAEAGYNPLEAVAFWTLYYGSYEMPDLFNLDGTSEEVNKKETASAKKNDKNKKTDDQKIVAAGASAAFRYIQANQTTKAKRMHPSFHDRFEELNRSIEMYWSDPKITDKLAIGDEEYQRVKSLVSKTATEPPAAASKNAKPKKGNKG